VFSRLVDMSKKQALTYVSNPMHDMSKCNPRIGGNERRQSICICETVNEVWNKLGGYKWNQACERGYEALGCVCEKVKG
jgi:hypothetical protein